MDIQILLLSIMVGLTLLAYMVAINSHGPTRLSISYFFATILLAGTVYLIVQHVNSGLNREKAVELQRLEMEKRKAEERIKEQEKTMLQSKRRTAFATKLSGLISKGTGLATSIMNVDLRDMSYEIDVLMARANKARKEAAELKKELDELSVPTTADFSESMTLMKDAVKNLDEASRYYYLFYRSDDTAQEQLRERIMRRKARSAYENFQKAGSLLATSS
ncbi:MAG: hypothetical protein GF398_19620 [Chitinivibrionales bacterium]|nr:hypothetical protein [Chitinivibrionales bacterium]